MNREASQEPSVGGSVVLKSNRLTVTVDIDPCTTKMKFTSTVINVEGYSLGHASFSMVSIHLCRGDKLFSFEIKP